MPFTVRKRSFAILAGVCSAALILSSPALAQSAPASAAASATAKPAPLTDLIKNVNIPYEMFTLSNGLRVIVHTDRKAPVVGVTVYYRVGSKNEPKGKTGFAHLFEHLMFGGSENVPEFDEPLTAAGSTALQLHAFAPVSAQSADSLSALRAARPTAQPSRASNRAREALSPLPAPTIRADFRSAI